jgi:putative DNA primase/helicase
VLPDAPVRHDLVVPKGWSVTPQGIGRIVKVSDGFDIIPVASAPILINGRFIDLAQGTESLSLTRPRDGKWKYYTVERAKVASTRTFTELANVGLPVTSKSSGNSVEYLATFEEVNLDCLPRMQVSEHLGWQGDNCSLGFLWGRTLLRGDSEQVTLTDMGSMPLEQWQDQLLAFRGADAGDEQIADAFIAAGSLDAWIHTVHLLVNYPKVLLAVYGALAPPLLKIFGTPNFILDWSGGTSGGKTSTLRLAGSTWGSPDERLIASVVGTWDATRVWINRASTVLQSLPLILDDTKRCKNTKDIAKIVYDVTSGRDRGRGSKGGIRTLGTWSTVLLSTGETPITSFSNDGGTRARVIPVWGSPFGKTDRTTASLVQTVNRSVMQNYGLAGPQFVQFLMQRQCDWESWRKEYHKVEAQYQDVVGDDPVAGRLCAYFAVLDMAAGIAHAALGLPWSYRDPIFDYIKELVSGTAEADIASQALNAVISWAQMNASSFSGRHDKAHPPREFAGKWDSGDSWAFIAFAPLRLKRLLTDIGFEPEAVILTWYDRNWLSCNGNRKDKQVRIDGNQTWTYAIRRSVIEEHLRQPSNDDMMTT